MKFTHSAMSQSDPSAVPLKFYSAEAAQAHADRMNQLIDLWDKNPTGLWNKDHWKSKPTPWKVAVL